MIDMFAPLQTVPTDGNASRHVRRHHRCWPNQVSGEYCALIEAADGSDRDEEHWYDDEGRPTDPRSPEIRNVVKPARRDELKAAFAAGAGAESPETDARFDAWFSAREAA